MTKFYAQSEVISVESFLKMEKSDIKQAKIIPPDLDDENACFGSIEVTYKTPKYKTNF